MESTKVAGPRFSFNDGLPLVRLEELRPDQDLSIREPTGKAGKISKTHVRLVRHENLEQGDWQ